MNKFFIVGVEGATIDGRIIKKNWLEQAAKNYDPEVYTARIWLEHFRGILPDGIFRACGDVLSLKTEKIKNGLLTGKTALLASLKPTPELIAINESDQKVFTSMEINEEFADTGEAYLVGLAVTDSPASLGTSRLAFSNNREPDEKTYISQFISTELAFDEEDLNMPKPISEFVSSLFNSKKTLDASDVKSAFSSLAQKVDEVVEEAVNEQIEQFIQAHPAPDQFNKKAFDDLQKQFTEFEKKIESLADKTGFDDLKKAVDDLKTDYDALKADIEKTPQFKQTPHSGGGEDKLLASC